MFRIVPFFSLAILLWGCRSSCLAQKMISQAGQIFHRGAVASDHPIASEIGVRILKQGGNAVDAAVATSFALSVARPSSCGLGGGGFMLIWNAKTQSAVALDYRERAPRLASSDMFSTAEGKKTPHSSRVGHLSVAVPGTVSGLLYALEKHGSLSRKEVMKPAIELAERGFLLDQHDREVQQSLMKSFRGQPQYQSRFRHLWELYLNKGIPWPKEAIFHSPQLPMLKLISDQGANAFTSGEIAAAIVKEMKKHGGIISLEDLQAIKPVERKPLQGEFENHLLFTMPPPSSGGVAMLETVAILKHYERECPLNRITRQNYRTPNSLHLLTECFKHAFADRAEYLGDADFYAIPIKRLLSTQHTLGLAKKIDLKQTQPLKTYGRFLPLNDAGTSHFSVVDSQGNMVACTETINTLFGSLVVVPRFGLILNNEMDDFAAQPGKPNAFGLIQSEANKIEAGKKPLSSMSPTIVVKDGEAIYALGGSGGPRIITGTTQVLFHLIRHEMSPHAAVCQPRLHHQWVPDQLLLEEEYYANSKSELEAKKHVVRRSSNQSVIQVVSRKNGKIEAASDPRKHGRPAGY